MARRDIVVIGGSAGGLTAVREILKQVPSDLPAAIFVLIHVSASSPALTATLLNSVSRLPVTTASYGETIRMKHVYVAPPDHHLLVQNGKMVLDHGARVNNFRPAIDPLFRTAAKHFGQRVIAIVLSGGMDDGTLGLAYIKSKGGITIVQDPADAEVPEMPMSAIRQVKVHHVARLFSIPQLILENVGQPTELARGERNMSAEPDPAETEKEILEIPDDPPANLTCPSCGGAIWETTEQGIMVLV